MKSSILLLLEFATVIVWAQSDVDLMRDLPACSLTCISQYIPQTDCADSDIACLCSTAELWLNNTKCVSTSCSIRDSLTSQRISTLTCGFPYRQRSVNLQALVTALCALALLVVILRMIVRWPGFSEAFGWDDGVILAAWVFSVPMVPLVFLDVRDGLGKDIWMVPVDRITSFVFEFWLIEHFYTISANLTKISLLCFYLRVFTTFHIFRKIVYGMITFTIIFILAFYTTLYYECTPLSYIWKGWDGEHTGSCVDIKPILRVSAVVNFLLDLTIMLLPLPLVYKVQKRYNWRKKIHIGLMFSFGFIVVLVSGLRMQSIFQYAATKNPTYDFVDPGIWALMENWVGIICACIPGTKMFVTKVAPKWLGLSSIDMSGRRGTGPTNSAAAAYGTRGSRKSVATGRTSSAAVRGGVENDSDFVRLKDMERAGHQSGVISKTSDVEVESLEMGEEDLEYDGTGRGSWLATK